MMVAGFAIPVVRATIMAVIYLLSIVFSRSHYKLNTLGIAAFIILLIEPTSIYDLSFHLSFSAVLGILLVNNYYPFSFSSLIHKLETSLKATLAATIFTLPLIVNTFGIMPLISVPSNMFFIPLVEFIIVPLGLLSFILFKIYVSLSVPLIIINEVFIKALLSSVNYISDISFSALTVPYLNKLNILLFYLSICIFFIKIHKNKLIYILVPITLFIISIIYIPISNRFNKSLQISFFDSGNRDTYLIRLTNGKNILIIGAQGDWYQNGFIEKSIISQSLLKTGISKIDFLILLTNNKDLLEGSAFILDKFKVDNLFTNGAKLKGKIWELIKKNKIIWKDLNTDSEPFTIDKTSFDFLFINNTNISFDASRIIILRIRHHEKSIIIGNLYPKYVIKSLLKNYNKLIYSDLIYIPKLVVSKQLLEFINQSNPKVIITKANNIKNVKQLKNIPSDIKLYNTMTQGMITVNIDNELNINTEDRF